MGPIEADEKRIGSETDKVFTFLSGEETSGKIGRNGRTRFRNRTGRRDKVNGGTTTRKVRHTAAHIL